MQAQGSEPWGVEVLDDQFMNRVVELERIPLSDLAASTVPGAYLQFLDAPDLEPILGRLIASGRYPAYAGVGRQSLRQRLNRHRTALRGEGLVGVDAVWVTEIACRSSAWAAYGEAVLIERLNPVFNGLGWGSRTPGSRRASQRCSPIDALLPGRPWAPTPTPRDAALARLQVLTNIVAMDADGPRWAPLQLVE